MNAFKKFSTNPLWTITTGIVLLAVSSLLPGDIVWWLTRAIQVIGIILIIFGIIIASAKLNSKKL